MKNWQILYLLIVGIGFLVGWITSTTIALIFVWTCVIVSEIINYRREIKEFERNTEES